MDGGGLAPGSVVVLNFNSLIFCVVLCGGVLCFLLLLKSRPPSGWTVEMSRAKNGDDKGLLWKLPAVNMKQLGKLGPGFGFGAGCGVGVAFGLIGGAGIGPGMPGLQVGFGIGAGCGIGLGFGYGVGRGISHDEHRRYTNVGKLFNKAGNLPFQDEISARVDELVINTKKVIRATSREIDKWSRVKP